MTKKLVWRLGKLPSPDEVRELVKDKIITQDEAREILFSSETEEDRDKKSLESEIKFLREMVEKLSSERTRTVEVIKEVYKPYQRWDWYKPYEVWCSSLPQNLVGGGTICFSDEQNLCTPTTVAGFSEIKTF